MERRNTVQRKIILETLKRLNNHPTTEELYAEIQKGYPTISKTTVYRNLRLLTQSGLVRRVSVPDGPERYEGQPEPHYHFKCSICGGVFDVDIPVISDIDARVAQKYGFDVSGHDIMFHGVCNKCKQM